MRTIFHRHDEVTGDGIDVEFDEEGDRLIVSSLIDGRGERVLVLLDGRETARQLARALNDSAKARTAKTPRGVAL